MQTTVSSHRSGDVTTVVVSGDVDLLSASAVAVVITDAVAADGVREVRVDLSGVPFLDSSGISTLVQGRRSADEHGVAYRVVGAQTVPRQVLELTGVWAHLGGDRTDGATASP